MALTKREGGSVTYLQIKDFSIWREIKTPVEGCEAITVNNPSNGETLTKYGFKFDELSGRVVKLEQYNKEFSGTRYVGFNLFLMDDGKRFSLEMPYESQVFQRFLLVAPNIALDLPLSISAFKGKPSRAGAKDKTAVAFRQDGKNVPQFYSREDPHGMPLATQDTITGTWDFGPQKRWLVNKLITETIPQIDAVAKAMAPSVGHDDDGSAEDDIPPHGGFDNSEEIPF